MKTELRMSEKYNACACVFMRVHVYTYRRLHVCVYVLMFVFVRAFMCVRVNTRVSLCLRAEAHDCHSFGFHSRLTCVGSVGQYCSLPSLQTAR